MKRGQIWVETVIYTLIGLSLIALVLAIVTPRINEFKDRSVVEQTIESFNLFDEKINDVVGVPGNLRIVEFKMSRGNLYFNMENDSIIYELEDSRSLFSEPGVEISIGRVNVTTIEGTKKHKVILKMSYNYNLTFGGTDQNKKFSAVSLPYEFSVENKGMNAGIPTIDISEGG